jgi:hypothetical protein
MRSQINFRHGPDHGGPIRVVRRRDAAPFREAARQYEECRPSESSGRRVWGCKTCAAARRFCREEAQEDDGKLREGEFESAEELREHILERHPEVFTETGGVRLRGEEREREFLRRLRDLENLTAVHERMRETADGFSREEAQEDDG